MGGGERGAMEDFLALGNGQLSERERERRGLGLCVLGVAGTGRGAGPWHRRKREGQRC